MNKSILMSVRPEHLVNILYGEKTLELRKSVPKDFKGWVYIYCTKGVKDILYKYKEKYYTQHYLTFTDSVDVLNSKIVARFWFDEYTKLKWLDGSLNNENMIEDYNYFYLEGNKRYYSVDWLLNNLQLTKVEVSNYGSKKELYAWHIKDLEIFDEPMELSNFYKDYEWVRNDEVWNKVGINPIKKAPQSWQYVYTKE